MEVTDHQKSEIVSFTILIVSLGAIGLGLAALTFMATRQIEAVSDTEMRRFLARLAWLSFVLLAVTLVVLFWTVTRLLRVPMRSEGPLEATPYVDAWALAGKRFKLDQTESPDQDEADEPEDPT